MHRKELYYIVKNKQKKTMEKNYNLIVSCCHHATGKHFIVCKIIFAVCYLNKMRTPKEESRKKRHKYKLYKMRLSFNFNGGTHDIYTFHRNNNT